MRNDSMLRLLLATMVLTGLSCVHSGPERTAQAARGLSAIYRYGCGSCHTIPGVSGAFGLAGPPLSGIASRIYIAGVLQNNPPNMIRWIENPKAVDEKTVMPNLGVTEQDATDIAGYLYTLR